MKGGQIDREGWSVYLKYTTDMLEQIVDSLEEQLAAARAYSCADNIHLFLRAPAALAFVLGNKKIFPGNIILYEYDQSSDSYAKSLERND